ncbi:MAG: CHAT domain-containing protein [Bradymonadia bacterium]
MAWVAFAQGDLESASQYIDEFKKLTADKPSPSRTSIDQIEGELALARNQYDLATTRFEVLIKRLENNPRAGSADALWRAFEGRGRAALGKGDTQAALADFRRALQEVERLGRRTVVKTDRGQFFADRRPLVESTMKLLLQEGRAAEAFEVADGDRARVLRAMQARLRVDRLTSAQRAEWSDRLGRFYTASNALAEAAELEGLAVGKAAEAQAAKLANLKREHEAAFDQAFHLLDEAAPMTVPEGASGDAASKQLKADEALLAMTPLGDQWLVFWMHGGQIEHQQIPKDADPVGPWRQRLAQDDIAHLYIIPGGHPKAFALPVKPVGSAPPLLQHVSVSFMPYAGLLQNTPTASDGSPLVLADTRSDLPYAAQSGVAVAQRLKGKLLKGPEAHREAVLPALGTASLIHFEGHGVLNPEDPWAAHLALAEGQQLAMPDLLTTRLEAQLVVLSGCETGTDAVLLRDDVVGLPEAFLAAGAQTVLATDRKVPDEATGRFMARFYDAGGSTRPAEALRQAFLASGSEAESVRAAWRVVGRR